MTKRHRHEPERPKVYDLLVLPPQDKPVYFIVERETDSADEDEFTANSKFLYESHSCPTNWLQPVYMSHAGDHDPHGLIRYVESRKESDLPSDKPIQPNDRTDAFDAWIEGTNDVIPDPIDI